MGKLKGIKGGLDITKANRSCDLCKDNIPDDEEVFCLSCFVASNMQLDEAGEEIRQLRTAIDDIQAIINKQGGDLP